MVVGYLSNCGHAYFDLSGERGGLLCESVFD